MPARHSLRTVTPPPCSRLRLVTFLNDWVLFMRPRAPRSARTHQWHTSNRRSSKPGQHTVAFPGRKALHRMQSDGCAMSALCHTRAGKSQAYVSQVVVSLQHTVPEFAASLFWVLG